MQEGTVVAVNQRRGMFIAQIDEGDFAVFELLAGIDIAIGDRVAGDLEALGREELRHLGQRRRFAVYGQSGPSSLAACRRLVGI
ncbi:hypothetical protein LMG27952_06883 [Paraburkholderia hiiakae]|uniref:Uncharacterized protein n=1 Tax=Paraburkholderia hiiakae TaxID=1081782 RepID=A0ABM8P912_9BURK|nr:hypothetical protein [Paraburkholderia hiiakae]CAD6559518.1 hypothetical protein LMG27952_06883 [Paraburkholderia hiiakae]